MRLLSAPRRYKMGLVLLAMLPVSSPAAPVQEPTLAELQALDGIRGKVKGRIIFSSKRGPVWAIWMMNADGAGLRRLTDERSNNRNCIWSSDFRKIYFNSDRDGRGQIFIMNENGSHVKNVSRSDKTEVLWGLTADESKILFMTHQDGSMRVFVREMPSGEVHELDFSEFPGREGKIEPRISPDGKRIAFLFKGGRGASRSVYAGEIDREYRVRNVIPIHLGCFAAWTRDSSRFIMCVFTPGGTALHLAKADGSRLEPLTAGGRWNYFPAWSPDEQWMLWSASPTEFHDHNNGRYDLYIQSLKERRPIRLTFHEASDIESSWGL